jgi:H+/Cl- antiporter ClcA
MTAMKRDDEKWRHFETYKGPPEPEWPGWLHWACKGFLTAVALGLVFAACGALLWILPYRIGRSWFALNEEAWMSWARFIGGGIIGIALVIRWWLRSARSPARRRRR